MYHHYRLHRADLVDDGTASDVIPSASVPTCKVPQSPSTSPHPRDGRTRVDVDT